MKNTNKLDILNEKNINFNNNKKNLKKDDDYFWKKFFKKKFIIIYSLILAMIIIILSLSFTLTNKNKNNLNSFYEYGSDCSYITNYSEEYVGYGRIGLEICFELDPEYIANDYISIYEITNDPANQETIYIKDYPLEYTTYDDGLYPNGLYNTYQYVPYNMSDHNKTYSIQVDINDKETGNYVSTIEIERLILYNNRKPNGFTIRNVKDYGDCYMEYEIFYPEGSGRIEEVYLEDEFGNILSTSKPITSDFFHYDYRGILYLPPNYTSSPQNYKIYVKYSHNITPYGKIEQEYRILVDEIIVLPFN